MVVDLEKVVEYPEENYTEEEKCVLHTGMIPESQDGTKYKELLNSLGVNGMSKEEIVSNLENLVWGYNYFKAQSQNSSNQRTCQCLQLIILYLL